MRHRPPSGHQYAIADGSSQAMVTQVGATLRSYTVDGRDVIDGFGIEERAVDGRGQVLAPWPNRLTDGRYRYGGRDCQAPLNEPSRHGAIHGLVRWLDWSPVAHDAGAVTLSCAVRPQPGYEWHLDLEVTYALDGNGLTVTCRAVNVDTARAPPGVGFHPYLTLGTSSVDGLADPDAGRSVRLWVDDAYHYLMVYTADRVGRQARRRTAIAVEPMTCPPDALVSGADLIELDPGASWHGSWGIQA